LSRAVKGPQFYGPRPAVTTTTTDNDLTNYIETIPTPISTTMP
jgi:hypothetical protein